MSNQDYGRDQQSRENATRSPGTTFHAPLAHSIPKLKPANAASCCSTCGITFHLFRSKYNCYNCGNVTCGRCSDHRAELPKFGYFEPVRVCSLCYSYLKIMEMDRSQLARLQTKQLREYISAYNLPCHSIIEKEDLINVIVSNTPLEECYEVYYRDHYPIAQPIHTSSHETASDIPSANYARTETQNSSRFHYQNIASRSQPQFQPQPSVQQRPAQQRPTQKQPPPPPHTAPLSLQTIIRDKVDVSKLSIKIIKEILKENCIDYSKMLEKSELVERLEILIKWAKYEMSRNTDEISDDGLCRVCCDAQSNCLFMDCGHMCTCLDCGKKLQETKNECPICRETIIKIIRVFRA